MILLALNNADDVEETAGEIGSGEGEDHDARKRSKMGIMGKMMMMVVVRMMVKCQQSNTRKWWGFPEIHGYVR